MNKLNIWTGTLTLFFALLLTACGGGGGATTAPIGDISGAWAMTLITDASACPVDTSKTETPTVEITQSGSSATVIIPGEGTYTGSVSGNILTWSGSYPDDGGTVQTTVSLTIDASCNTMSGLANWTWSGNGTSCQGTTQASGTRNDPVGCGATTDPAPTTGSVAAPVDYDFEDGTVPAAFVMSGDADWSIDAVNGSGGSGKSLFANGFASAIGAKGCVAITVSGASNITFDFMVSSEANFDFLRFYIDNNLEDEASGFVSWTNVAYSDPTSGTYEFKWCYEKDDAVVDGSDTAWIDNITIN